VTARTLYTVTGSNSYVIHATPACARLRHVGARALVNRVAPHQEAGLERDPSDHGLTRYRVRGERRWRLPCSVCMRDEARARYVGTTP